MNTYWQLLGISPTGDKKEIRRAFAAQSRLHHPEEEPEYFVQLNQAYKEALREAAAMEKNAGRETDAGESVLADTGRTVEVGGSEQDRPDRAVYIGGSEQGRTVKETEENGSVPADTNETAQARPSLLERMLDAEQSSIQRSMQEGALHDLILLFENPKQAKQVDTWRRFFLSEAFLGEQFSEEFGKGLASYVMQQTLYPWDNLPMGFLQELAIAYAFVPHFAGEEYLEGKKYPKEWYKVSVENTFPARKHVAEIFNMQGVDCDLKAMTRKILNQPANKVRHNSFSDYLTLKEMEAGGQLTEEERETWQHILGMSQEFYLFERNGKKPGSGDYESRSECGIKLYVQWLKDTQLPACVLKTLYLKYRFQELAHSSTRGLYGALKEQVLRQFPDIEEVLFADDGTEQLIKKVYITLAKIINDHQNNYEKSIYEETPEIQERVAAFFAMPEWKRLQKERGLFERIYDGAKRFVMPGTLAEGLIRYLSAGAFPGPKCTELMESLIRSLSTPRNCRELDYLCALEIPRLAPEKIDGGSADFWQYFLMRGFGYRHRAVRGTWEADYIYVENGQCYLPAYINYLYAPSRAWQKVFTGFDEEQARIAAPVSAVCSLPDGRQLRVEFHYHYCLYFVEEVPVTAPALTFRELAEYAPRLAACTDFFFLLAVTAIEEQERQEAVKLIEGWLAKIFVHQPVRPVIAGLLAADNDRLPKDTAAVLYEEQERFCFRAVVTRSGLQIFRQVDFGWEDRIFRWPEFGWRAYPLPARIREEAAAVAGRPEASAADTTALAAQALHLLRQPDRVLRAAYAVGDMDVRQKTAVILEAMGYEKNREGYCVLRYGTGQERRHDKVFYGAQLPFGHSIRAQSTEYERSRNYLTSVSNTRIKEGKQQLARFGWGFKYSHKSDYGPMYLYLGESGRYFAYGSVRMHRADTMTDLLADFYGDEFAGVTAVEAYEGCLSVSRLDHRLEYCYRQDDFLQSIHSMEDTDVDVFTRFGGRLLFEAFREWLDAVLAPGIPQWVNNIVIGTDPERNGALFFVGLHVEAVHAGFDFGDEEMEEVLAEEALPEEEPEQYHEPHIPQVPLLVWEKGADVDERNTSLNEALQWYLETGSHADLLKEDGIRIEVVCCSVDACC